MALKRSCPPRLLMDGTENIVSPVVDFEEVLKLEPGNKQALNELQKLQLVRLLSRSHRVSSYTGRGDKAGQDGWVSETTLSVSVSVRL